MKEGIKHIAILGSTGSIGTQTLDIIEYFPGLFRATVLTANNRWELLAEQARKFKPLKVVIANKDLYSKLKEALSDMPEIEVMAGADAICEAVTIPEVDMAVTAMVGYSGLLPTIAAIEAGKTIALANKETLVVAGEVITAVAKKNQVDIIPVDSEHSAIFQCLVGENRKAMRKILLTASGGPFRTLPKEKLAEVSVKEALAHPNWDMGAKVTIDSASMMNKGFEMIEARWLFDCEPRNIEILVHPQSIVHSMVEYQDGSIKAQMGIPDMHIPIQYALSYPERLKNDQYLMDWCRKPEMADQNRYVSCVTQLTFEKPDFDKFALLRYAFEAIEKGGNMPCILNAANEVAVKLFLQEKIKFTDMARLAQYVMDKTPFIPKVTLDDLIKTNEEALSIATKWDKNSIH